MENDLKSLLNQDSLEKYQIVDWGYTEDLKASSWENYQNWTEKGHHTPLLYLEGERGEKRKDLRDYFPEIQSSLVFLFSYSKQKFGLDHFYKNNSKSNGLKISSYVFGFKGEDYHEIVRGYLSQISDQLKESFPNLETKFSLDTQPILERDLAYRAGLGWFGKNSMFINKSEGSFFLLGSLLLNEKLPLEKLKVEVDHCGQCSACFDSCPTNAIDPDTRTIHAQKCISTFTIELFKEGHNPPDGFTPGTKEIFGCDICQDVCPWNKRVFRNFSKKKDVLKWEFPEEKSKLISEFFLKRPLKKILSELNEMSNRGFKKFFKGTPLERTGRVGLLKNLRISK